MPAAILFHDIFIAIYASCFDIDAADYLDAIFAIMPCADFAAYFHMTLI
jgi:hypothetical protein